MSPIKSNIKGAMIMKVIYGTAWFLLVAATLVSAFTGSFNPPAVVVYGLMALGLVYAIAVWSVVVNTRELHS
jgi:hypothetical protein